MTFFPDRKDFVSRLRKSVLVMANNTDKELLALKNNYGIVGFAPSLTEALKTALKVAPTDLSVLIQGESGVGKEVVPRLIHDYSLRKKKGGKYIAINCGSIPEGTIDSELFGHEKGSFTSAIGEHKGYFEVADGGTLFLDEVGELPMSTQARLLRVLETGEFIRVGSNTPQKADVRIVAATNVNIPNAIREGRFREDLYYRLCTININIPPLRKRGRDVLLLFKYFANITAEKYNIHDVLSVSKEGEEVLMSYKWPGNIRQLKNIVEQISILSDERVLTPQILANYGIVRNSDTERGIALVSQQTKSGGQYSYEQELKMLMRAVMELRNEVDVIKQKIGGGEVPAHAFPVVQHTAAMPSVDVSPGHAAPSPAAMRDIRDETDIQTAEEVLDEDVLNINEMEKRNILKALQRNHYRRKDAANELGFSERTLYRKIKAYGIDN